VLQPRFVPLRYGVASGAAGSDDTGFVGKHDCLDPVADAELGEQPADKPGPWP
jgi:hypothetical protein